MPEIKFKPLLHHGWQIEVVQQDDEFFFHCYPPEWPDYCNDGLSYPNFEAAMLAAQQFIDREVAIQVVMTVVEDWLTAGKISDIEFWNLTNFD